MERRLAAILCADVVGYSRLMGLDEAGTLGCLKAFETDTVEPVVDCHGGRIVKRMGDGYLVAFTSVVAAVDAALATYRLPKILLAPFRHLGSRGDTETLAAGVTETLAAALAHFEELELIDPGSAESLVVERGARAAGQQLGATYVLEGSLQMAAAKVRVGVQLIDPASALRVWSETLDRPIDDVFALQDEVTALVASTVGEAVGEEQARAIEGKPDDALDAYELMLRGLQHLHRQTPDDVAAARNYFGRALVRAPDQYFLVLCHCWCDAAEYGSGWRPVRSDALGEGIGLVRDVLRRHDRSAQAHRLMARLLSIKGAHAEALAQSERSLRLNPHNSDMLISHAYLLARAGRAAEAVPLAERALAINPYAPTFYSSNLAFCCFFAGDYDKGLAALQTIQGAVGPSRLIRTACLAALERIGEAGTEAQKVLAETPDFDLDRLIQGLCLASDTDRARLRDALRHAGL